MAGETLSFDIVGKDAASGSFRAAAAAASDMSGKMDLAAKSSYLLNSTLEKQRKAADVSAGATLALAKADRILGEEEKYATAKTVEETIAIDRATAALKREEDAKKKEAEATRKAAEDNKGFAATAQKAADSLKSKGGPTWLGPALALAPVATSLLGVTAGAAIGLGGAFVAGGGALAAFGAVAKPVLTDAQKAATAVEKAQNNYNVAIANGVNPAKAYRTEQIAIGRAYADLSPQQIALSKQLGNMASAWQNLKAAQTPVVAGALQPWLKSVTDLTTKLAPIISAVSPVIKGLGTQFDALINSTAFRGFRDFVANTGSKVVGAVGGTLIDFVKAFMILLPKFNPLIMTMTNGIAGLGPAVLKWASSKKTADDITKFMDWFHTNGPAVGDLLKNIGLALKALAPGLGPAATVELNVISGFFATIAKLPPSIAKPLIEAAGVLLTLNKLGVFSVGVKIVGAAAGWVKKLLGGATVDLGAAGMQRAGDTMVGAAAAMQKAADTLAGGAVAGGAKGVAVDAAAAGAGSTGLWSKLLPGVTRVAGGLAIAVAVTELLVKPALQGTSSGKIAGTNKQGNWWDNPGGANPTGTPSQQGVSTWVGLGHQIEAAWNTTWNNTITRTAKGFHDLAGWFDTGRHAIAAAFSGAASWLVSTGGSIITGLSNGLTTAWKGVSGWFGHVWGWVTGVFSGAGSWLWQKGHDIIQGAWNGIQTAWSATSQWLSGTWGRVVGFFSGAGSWLWNKGHDIIQGLWNGIQNVWNGVSRWLGGTWGRVVGFFSGAGSWLWQKGHDVLQGFWNGLTTVWNKVTGWIKSLAGWIKSNKGPISFDRTLLEPAGRAIMTGLRVGLEGGFVGVRDIISGAAGNIGNQFQGLLSLGGKIGSFFSNLFGGGGSGAPGTSAQVKAWIQAALSIAGKPASWLGPMEILVQKESGGNPRAMNPQTAGVSGQHAEGIAQTIPGTFAQFALSGHGNIWNPIDDLIASVRYISAVWRSPANIPGLLGGGGYQGYALGTSSAAPGWAWVGEHGKELVHFGGGEQVYPQQVIPRGAAAPPKVVLQVRSAASEFDRFMTSWLIKSVATTGGGSVQVAFGSGTG